MRDAVCCLSVFLTSSLSFSLRFPNYIEIFKSTNLILGSVYSWELFSTRLVYIVIQKVFKVHNLLKWKIPQLYAAFSSLHVYTAIYSYFYVSGKETGLLFWLSFPIVYTYAMHSFRIYLLFIASFVIPTIISVSLHALITVLAYSDQPYWLHEAWLFRLYHIYMSFTSDKIVRIQRWCLWNKVN